MDPDGSLKISVTFASSCVSPGQEQRIQVATAPGAVVAFHAIYADGAHSGSPEYPGGNNAGEADGSGAWEDEWVVGSNAAPGSVHVEVLARTRDTRGTQSASFSVANADGRC